MATSASACCAYQLCSPSSGPVATSPASTARSDRTGDDLAILDRQLDGDPQCAVRRIAPNRQRAALPGALRGVGRLRRDIANLPATLLDLARGRLQRVREEQILFMQVCRARERAHFGVRQLS